MAFEGGLMERGGVAVCSDGVVAVGVFTGVEQDLGNFQVAELGGHGEGEMAVFAAGEVWNKRIPTGELNRWFEHALETHQPPLVSGRRLKLRYMTQAKARPPTFVVFGTRAEQTPEDYSRYLVNGLRETFKLPGTPIRLQFRRTKNPFVDEE